MKENKQNCTDLFSKKPKTKNKRNLLFVTTVMLTALSTQTIETYALTYTNLSERSATAPSNIYGKVVESQTEYLYRDKEFTDTPITQVRTITPMLEFGRWKNNGAWTQPDSQAHREIQPQTTYREKDLTDKSGTTIEVTGNPTEWTNKDVTLTVKATNAGSGVKKIRLPNGKVVTGDTATYTVDRNGNYEFRVTDNAGNETTETVKVTNIDKTKPTIKVTGIPKEWTNKDVTLTITATDSQSGVKQIELPDGTIVKGGTATYTVAKNRWYEFKATDNAGNETTHSVFVGKIDKEPPSLWVEYNRNWTNQDVTITIRSRDNHDGGGIDYFTLPDGSTVHGKTEGGTVFTTYTVSANGDYEFKVTDKAGNETIKTVNVTNIDRVNPTIEITGNPTEWTNRVLLKITGRDDKSGVKEIIYLHDGHVVNDSTAYNEIKTNGEYTYKVVDRAGNETTETVNVTKLDNTKPTIEITGNPTEWTNKDVTLTIKATDSQSGVQKIILPDWTIVNGDTATYTVDRSGDYRFYVYDNAGNYKEQWVKVTKIDKREPTATITGNSSGWTNQDVELTIKATDTESGVKQIELPDGTIVKGDTATYRTTATSGRRYTFKVTDNAGNVAHIGSHPIQIDKEPPSLWVEYNRNWTNQDVTLTIRSRDNLGGSGIDYFTLPDGSTVHGESGGGGKFTTYTVKENGNYEFKVTDKAGNATIQTANVTNIDKTAPTIEVAGNPKEWTNKNVTLNVMGKDNLSGIKQIESPDGTIVNDWNAYYTVEKNGDYKFKVTDHAGNETTEIVKVDKIDKTAPIIEVTPDTDLDEWTNQDITFTITGTDNESGIQSITLPNGKVLRNGENLFPGFITTGYISDKGEHLALTDNGNLLSDYIEVDSLNFAFRQFKDNGEPVNSYGEFAFFDKDKKFIDRRVFSQLKDENVRAPEGTKYIRVWSNPPKGSTILGMLMYTTEKPSTITKYVPYNSITDTVSSPFKVTNTVSENGDYEFKVTDNLGHETTETVNVDKIDKTKPTVEVTGNPTEWTKEDVTLTIKANDTQSGVLSDEKVLTISENLFTGFITTGYISEKGEHVGLKDPNLLSDYIEVDSLNFSFRRFKDNGEPVNSYGEFAFFDKDKKIIDRRIFSQSRDENVRAPEGTKYIRVWSRPVEGSTGLGMLVYTTEKPSTITKYEEHGIFVMSENATYTVSKNGDYRFVVFDKAGNVATETVKVTKIDKTPPTLDVKYPTEWTNQAVDLIPIASDSESGLKSIQLPNGLHAGSNFPYRVHNNGNFTFKAFDKVGNETIKIAKVTNIDSTAPTVEITGNPKNWTNQDAVLTIKATDTQSGVKQIELPDGKVVTGDTVTYTVGVNGNYKFKITDHAGNVLTQTVNVTKIDKTAPIVTVTVNPTHWTNQDVTLTISGIDTQSGVQSITSPDGTLVMTDNNLFPGFTTTGYIENNGEHIKNNPNLLSDYIEVHSLNFAFRRFKDDGTPINNYGEFAFFDKDKKILGARYDTPQTRDENVRAPEGTKYIRVWSKPVEGSTGLGMLVYTTEKPSTITQYKSYWEVVTADTATYTVSKNGDYTFKVFDKAGNETIETVHVTKIDKTKPVITYSLTPNTWTNSHVTINVTATDDVSGMKEIMMPNGAVVSTSTASYTVSKNGVYYFKATDNVDNETVLPISVTNIDVKAPEVNIDNNENWTNQDVQINITGTD